MQEEGEENSRSQDSTAAVVSVQKMANRINEVSFNVDKRDFASNEEESCLYDKPIAKHFYEDKPFD